MSAQTVLIASDHAGVNLKSNLMKSLREINWIDLGTGDAARVDYPDFADRVAKKISEADEASSLDSGVKSLFGVLICGSGQGMAMRANRYPNVRAAIAWNDESAMLSRQHNDANILCLGARLIDLELAKSLIQIFIATAFEGGRHSPRVEKIEGPLK